MFVVLAACVEPGTMTAPTVGTTPSPSPELEDTGAEPADPVSIQSTDVACGDGTEAVTLQAVVLGGASAVDWYLDGGGSDQELHVLAFVDTFPGVGDVFEVDLDLTLDTAFSCALFTADPPALNEAVRAFDSAGDVGDCVAFGSAPELLTGAGDYAGCRVE